jgi:hypothetical protein
VKPTGLVRSVDPRDDGGTSDRQDKDLRPCRIAGRQPEPRVGDDVLADRIRSSLGPLRKRLDVPHVHVTVERHVVLLHGEVGTEADATAIERAVRQVSGVRGIESYLHIGLLDSDTRPSEGRTSASPSTVRAE